MPSVNGAPCVTRATIAGKRGGFAFAVVADEGCRESERHGLGKKANIDDNGFIYRQTIGGWDPQQLIGQRMTIWSAAGPVPAVISRKPIHLLSDEERKQVAKLDDLWLDIGARDREEAASVVKIGDGVT